MNQQQEVQNFEQRKKSKYNTAILLGLLAVGLFFATITGLFF
jgi:hypothetical protein